MIISHDTTYGIDTAIKKIQNYLDEFLTWNTPVIYGRVYANQKGDRVVPEAYSGDGEYKEVFLNDNQNAQIGFHVVERAVNSAVVDVIFTGNITKIYSSDLRLDEKAFLEAVRVLEKSQFEVEGVKTGAVSVFSGFTTDPYRYADIHPFFCFAITGRLTFADDFCQ